VGDVGAEDDRVIALRLVSWITEERDGGVIRLASRSDQIEQ
jgi:hypothetical protein